VGGVEEVATSGATTTTTAYYYAGSKRIGLSVNGVVSYLAADGLGSADVTLSASGSATASALYAPYGGARYSSGTMPGTYGFTGQRSDAASGLDYYGSRYYDPLAGQFARADSVLPGGGFDLWGLSRYAYVEGNPIIRVDPSGRSLQCPPGGCGGDPAPPPPIDPDPCGGLCGPGVGGGSGAGGGTGGTGGRVSGGAHGGSSGGTTDSRNRDPLTNNPCAQFYGLCLPPVAPNSNIDLGGCLAESASLSVCLSVQQDAAEQFDAALNNPFGRLFHSNGDGDSAAGSAERDAAQSSAAERDEALPVERIYEDNPKHRERPYTDSKGNVVSPRPKDGQRALDQSVPVSGSDRRRVGIDANGDKVDLRLTLRQELEDRIREIWHGFVP
jgi:RHS repeat-associated protein